MALKILLLTLTIFQFHYGAVGSHHGNFSGTSFIYFNSTMVRLGASYICVLIITFEISIPLWCGWEIFDNACKRFFCKFQFHYGAVGRNSIGLPLNRIIENFNSTMVRLGVDNVTTTKGATLFQFHYGAVGSLNRMKHKVFLSQFQFHYGAVGSVPCGIFQRSFPYFNSTMVRLGGCIG